MAKAKRWLTGRAAFRVGCPGRERKFKSTENAVTSSEAAKPACAKRTGVSVMSAERE